MKALRCGYAAKGFLSLLGVISVFIEPAFERLYHSVVQFLGWYFCRNLRVIVLRIVVAPLVVFVSADFSSVVLLGNSSPSANQLRDKLEHDPEYQLPEPQTFMTAKSYKAKFADPLIKKLKKMVKSLIVQCAKAWDNYHRINERNGKL